MMRPLSTKPCEEKLSSEVSNVSEASSRNSSAPMASGTAASEEHQKLSQSLKKKGKHERTVCMILCKHINEICCSTNGGTFFY